MANNSPPLFSTAYLPPLEYMAFIVHTGRATIELHESYPKQTWRNRCRIITANGLHDLSIPVQMINGNNTKTKDIVTSRHQNWQIKHWRAIKSAYAKSAFFIYYKDLFEEFFLKPYCGLLWKFNQNIMEALFEEMNIRAYFTTTKSFIKPGDYNPDLRFSITPKQSGQGGEIFREWREYQQVFSERHGFVPNLSILDLIFNMGPETGGYLKELNGHSN